MNNDTSDGGATVPCISLFDVTDLCQREGIELRGDDGQPYCCGERMNVRGGIIGPDFAECRKCGKAIGNAAKPATKSCTWTEDADGNWHTGCQQIHVIISGTPDENGYVYCPYCGGKIENEGGK